MATLLFSHWPLLIVAGAFVGAEILSLKIDLIQHRIDLERWNLEGEI